MAPKQMYLPRVGAGWPSVGLERQHCLPGHQGLNSSDVSWAPSATRSPAPGPPCARPVSGEERSEERALPTLRMYKRPGQRRAVRAGCA